MIVWTRWHARWVLTPAIPSTAALRKCVALPGRRQGAFAKPMQYLSAWAPMRLTKQPPRLIKSTEMPRQQTGHVLSVLMQYSRSAYREHLKKVATVPRTQASPKKHTKPHAREHRKS